MKKLMCLVLFCLMGGLSVLPLVAQPAPEKKIVSLFRLNYFQAPPYAPNGLEGAHILDVDSTKTKIQGSGKADVDAIFALLAGGIDQAIEKAFTDLGRFSVAAMPQRLDDSNTEVLVRAIRDFQSKVLLVPATLGLAGQAFAEADFNRLVQSSSYVIPSAIHYDIVYEENPEKKTTSPGEYRAEISLLISVIGGNDLSAQSRITVVVKGTDSDSAENALQQAIGSIPGSLEFEIRKAPAFRIVTGVTQIINTDVVLEFGKNLGVQLGDEYAIIQTEDRNGVAEERQTGLMVIRDIRERVSIAQIIYADPAVKLGDTLREAPRIGVDFTPHVTGFITTVPFEIAGFSVGLRGTVSRGFFALRPLIDIGVIFGAGTNFGPDGEVPVSFMLGGEYNLNLGRLRLAANVLGGMILLLPPDEGKDAQFGGLRAQADVKVSFLVADTLEVFAEGGYAVVFSGGTFAGVTVSAGVTIR